MTETKGSLGSGAVGETKETRSAPSYVGIVPAQKLVNTFEEEIDGKKVQFRIKGYEPNIVFVEGIVEVENIFKEETLDIKEKVVVASRGILQKKYSVYKDFEEEYGIFCVSQYEGEPEKLFSHAQLIATFLKSEKEQLDEKEITQTLEASIKYGKDDLLIVDWDGAFIFDSSGAFDETIELLELGNYQLLRYRMLDFELDNRFNKLSRLLQKQQRRRLGLFRVGEVKEAVSKIILARSRAMTEFEDLERNVKLIGDWYSARVFSLIEKKFHIEAWRRNIKEKFEALEDVYNMASENFNLSFDKRMEIILIIGWTILQIGWFVLLALEFWVYV